MPHDEYTPEQIARFWGKVDRSGGPDACWPWPGGRNHNGYGRFCANRRYGLAHRVSYALTKGAIPTGLEVCHNCPDGDNPACSNPAHFFLGTQTENMADRDRKGRVASGDRNGMRTRPERNRMVLYPGTERGEHNPFARLTDEQVLEIRRLYAASGMTRRELSRRFGVHYRTIHRIISRERWAHLP